MKRKSFVPRIHTAHELVAYLRDESDSDDEMLVVASLTSEGMLTDVHKTSAAGISTACAIKFVCGHAISTQADSVMVVVTKTLDSLMPSSDELDLFWKTKNALSGLYIGLSDYIFLTRLSYNSMRSSGYL